MVPGQVLPIPGVSVPAVCAVRCQVGEGVVPGQVHPIPGVSEPAVCAVRWDDPGAR